MLIPKYNMVMRLIQSQFVLCDLSRSTKNAFQARTNDVKYERLFALYQLVCEKPKMNMRKTKRKRRLTKLVGLFCEARMQEKFSMALR